MSQTTVMVVGDYRHPWAVEGLPSIDRYFKIHVLC